MLVRDYIEQLERLPLVSADRIIGRDPIVVLAPHPDDETLGCGGLIAAACCSGTAVEVVVVTDGSGSHPASTNWPPRRLAGLRREETRRAVATLGLSPDRLTFLDLKDAAAPRSGPDFEHAVDAIGHVVNRVVARTMFVTWRRDPHCDHEAASLMADAVVGRNPGLRIWSYPIWGLHLRPDDEFNEAGPEGVRLDIAPWRAAKRAAIACHASQMTDLISDDPGGFRFTETALAPFLVSHERFIETRRP